MSWIKYILQWLVGVAIALFAVVFLAVFFLWVGNIFVDAGIIIIVTILIFNIFLLYKKQGTPWLLSLIMVLIGLLLIVVGWPFRTEEYGSYFLIKNGSHFVGQVDLNLQNQYFVNRKINGDKVGFILKSSGYGCSPDFSIKIEHNGSTKNYAVNNLQWQKSQSFLFNINWISQSFFSSMICGGGGRRMATRHNLEQIIPIDFIIDSGTYKFDIKPLNSSVVDLKIGIINY